MESNSSFESKLVSIEELATYQVEGLLNYSNMLIVTGSAIPAFLGSHFQMNAFIIVLCQKGNVHLEINSNEIMMEDCSVLISMPENRIRISDFTKNCDVKTVIIAPEALTHMTTDMLQKTAFYMASRSYCLFNIAEEEMKALIPYHSIIQSSLFIQYAEKDEVIKNLLQSFIFTILSLMSANCTDNFKEDYRLENRPYRIIYENFMNLLSKCPPCKYDLKFFSDRLYLSSKYLSKAVTQHSGKSPLYWIRLYIISEAKHLLKYSDLSSQQVAYKLNFPDQSSFGKFFKDATGLTPMQFAKGYSVSPKKKEQ